MTFTEVHDLVQAVGLLECVCKKEKEKTPHTSELAEFDPDSFLNFLPAPP